MAIAGQIIENPVTGERITFRRTAADTAGELLELDLELAPGGKVPGAHRHPKQEERFEVLSGRLELRLGLRRIVAEAGEVVTVPAVRDLLRPLHLVATRRGLGARYAPAPAPAPVAAPVPAFA